MTGDTAPIQRPKPRAITREQLEACRGALTDHHAEVLEQSLLFNYQQIADNLNLNLGTVKSRLARGRDIVDRELKRQQEAVT